MNLPIETALQRLFPNLVLQNEVLNAKVRFYAPKGKPQQDFIESEISKFQKSSDYLYWQKAQAYYINENDINTKVRKTFNGKGNKVTSKLSNTKRSHAFFRDLVDQRVRYLLTKPFSINTEDTDLGRAYAKELDVYLTDEFRRRFKNLGKQSTINGLEWLQVGYTPDGKLEFKRVPRSQVIPFWADEDHTILDAVIKFYTITVYTGQEDKEITKVEFWTNEGVWYYEQDETGFHEDPDVPDGVRAHFYTVSETPDNSEDKVPEPVGMNWDRVPFIAFKASADELSLLKLVKSLIDDYDETSSNLSNLMKDAPESIKVVMNYDGTNPEEFLQKLADYRIVFLREGGSLTTVSDPIDIAGTYVDLAEVRKNIYNFGSGIDYNVTNLGNSTGVGLKFLYAKLSAAADDMADEFQASFEQLRWFINQDIMLKGGQDYSGVKAQLVFNTDMIINETETIQNVIASKGTISQRTNVANHPWVTNVDDEIAAVKAEESAEMDALIKKYGLPNAGQEDKIDEEDV